jgi:hypothetical protein
VVRRKTSRRHMTCDHQGRTSEKATLQVRAADEILGTHRLWWLIRGTAGVCATCWQGPWA